MRTSFLAFLVLLSACAKTPETAKKSSPKDKGSGSASGSEDDGDTGDVGGDVAADGVKIEGKSFATTSRSGRPP